MVRARARLLGAICGLVLLLASPLAAGERRIVAFGDSLTAGYGLAPGQSFPAVLERRLRADGLAVRVENAGVSGDTTAGGRARLEWAFAGPADLAIVALGANDMLRGVDPETTRVNLEAIVAGLKQKGVAVLLAGMKAPRNLGADYAAAFDRIYPELAARHGAVLYPFFLAGVAAEPALNLEDGLHPNAAGVEHIAAAILPYVKRALGAD